MKPILPLFLLAGAIGVGTTLAAGPAGFLGSLAEPQPGRAMHASSTDRTGMNGDAVYVAPGQTITLLDAKGAGCIHRFWMTLAPRTDVAILSQAILRIYWDGDSNPSVECPLGAFFGVGFGEQRDYISAVLSETSGGYNCYWPMPYHTGARWTLTNGADHPINSFYYNIDYTALDSVPASTRVFHAQFRREDPTHPGRNYTILDTEGAGTYVGTALFMSGKALYYLEGNEAVYVDGESKPSILGTGTEDYFGSGWYFDRGPYSAPYHGLVIKDEHRVSAYRWHIPDPIPYTKSIRFTIEHGTGDGIEADYSSVAYFYQSGPALPPPPLPANLLPSKPGTMRVLEIPGAVEAESLVGVAVIKGGGAWVQDMGNWGYGELWSRHLALFWSPAGGGSTLTLPVPIRDPATRTATLRMVTGPNCGTVRIAVDGTASPGFVDLYAPAEGVKEVALSLGEHHGNAVSLKLTYVGNNAASVGSLVGIDAIVPGR